VVALDHGTEEENLILGQSDMKRLSARDLRQFRGNTTIRVTEQQYLCQYARPGFRPLWAIVEKPFVVW
jgi:hypothetical protein